MGFGMARTDFWGLAGLSSGADHQRKSDQSGIARERECFITESAFTAMYMSWTQVRAGGWQLGSLYKLLQARRGSTVGVGSI
jgi:hypothetical protein